MSCQTSKFYAQANTLLRNFRYCSDDVKCMLFRSFCTNMYCSPLWFTSTSSNIKTLETSSCCAVVVRMLIEVFTFGNNCQCFNDLIGISTISAVMMLLSC